MGEFIENILVFENQRSPMQPIIAPNELDQMPLGMAYTPMQKWKKLYEDEVGYQRGTIFEQLDLPFIGEDCK